MFDTHLSERTSGFKSFAGLSFLGENPSRGAHIKKQKKVTKMELSNKHIEDLFLKQIKELTIRTNRQLRSFDAQFSGIIVK